MSQLAESTKRLEELSHLSEEATKARQEEEFAHSGTVRDAAAQNNAATAAAPAAPAGTVTTSDSIEAEPPPPPNAEEVSDNLPAGQADTVAPHTTGVAPESKRPATGSFARGALSSKRRRMSAAKDGGGSGLNAESNADEKVGIPHGQRAYLRATLFALSKGNGCGLDPFILVLCFVNCRHAVHFDVRRTF